MAMTKGQRVMIGITGAAAIVGGGSRVNSEYNDAQSLRGRDENLVSDIAQYAGDLPHYVNSTVISPENQEERESWETPFGNTIPSGIIVLMGVGAVAMAYRNK